MDRTAAILIAVLMTLLAAASLVWMFQGIGGGNRAFILRLREWTRRTLFQFRKCQAFFRRPRPNGRSAPPKALLYALPKAEALA